MKTIRIFLASSEEMDYDRMVFGNLVRRLDDVYEKRGIRLKLFEWEDYDSAFNDRRKQDEYNDNVRNSDIFLALFHKKAGQFTVEEFDVASEAFKEKASPKVYTYLKDLKPGEEASPELEEFKHRLFDEMGHYWCRYDNRDSLQFQFVMQLQLVETGLEDSMKVEEGDVRIDGVKVASMDRLQFAAGNEDYVKMSEEFASLPPKIEKARLRLEKFPDDEDLIDDLQQKLDRYNKLKKEFAEYQKILFDTAKRVTRLQGKRITDRMRRAMDAFNEGKIREANIILDEAEADARRNLQDYEQSKEITELKRQAVISSIEELLFKATTVIAETSRPREERVEIADRLYDQAEEMATIIVLERIKYSDLLLDHGRMLGNYARYTVSNKHLNKAIQLVNNSLTIKEELFGKSHIRVAALFEQIALLYKKQGDLIRSLEFYEKAFDIFKTHNGEESLDVARICTRIGDLSSDQHDYNRALAFHSKALQIHQRLLGENNELTAYDFYSLGIIYNRQNKGENALAYLEKSSCIRERLTGYPDPWVCETIGSIYKQKKDYPSASKAYEKALSVREKNDPLGMDLLTEFARDEVSELHRMLNEG